MASFPDTALDALGLRGKRAIVFFIQSDTAFGCAKELQAFEERADQFRELGCGNLVAVRAPSGADEASAARYPSLTFVEDEDDALKVAAGLDAKGWLGRTPARGTFVLATNGTVCGTVSAAVEAQAHAGYAMRLLQENDAAVLAAEEASKPSVEELKALVAKQIAPTTEEAGVEAARVEQSRQMKLRAQALYAEANSRAFYSFTTTLDEELAAEALKAAERAAAAASKKQRARADTATAEAAGDERAAKVAVDEVQAAALDELRAAEDELSMMSKQADMMLAPINVLRGAADKEEAQAADLARKAYSLRVKATRALLALDDEAERRQVIAS